MFEPLRVAVAGIGRMGSVHARNILAIGRETGKCKLAAIVDIDPKRLVQFAVDTGCAAEHFHSVEALAEADVCNATLVVTPTDRHREHASTLIHAGHRILMEKPLTGTLAGDREFSSELDQHFPDSLMLAFQRRFDEALVYAKELVQNGQIGRVYKIYSALEDSGPPPAGYQSDGILPDMSIHNVDEIIWLTGKMPTEALAIGSRLYGHRVSTCQEDFDDALLYMWFGPDQAAQIQVSRNHVSGYRVETAIYGEEGQIQVGRFCQKPEEIVVEGYGRRLGAASPIRRVFHGGTDIPGKPEFVPRYEAAYKAEAVAFIDCVRAGKAFPTSHRDGLRAIQVIDAAMRKALTRSDAAAITR